ncbi:TIGR02587 family membrane protein [Deinococcus petrolearius]|uniref:TIGR02587 family membrane protein n=1 Tax=Deinococcus petrolearius TaxID=1751295 RepID=A0ABW1DIR6_9DEIO
MTTAQASPNRQTALGLARGTAGGLLLGLPVLMTMEMWQHGYALPTWKLLLLWGVNFLVLLVLEYYSGFQDEETLADVAQDAVIAAGLGLVVAAALLWIFGVIGPGMGTREVVGKVVAESIPVSIGASVAAGQLGTRGQGEDRKRREAGYWGTVAIALGGAVVFGFNVAPTEEPMLVGLMMSDVQTALLLLVSLVQTHAVVYALDFRGSDPIPEGRSPLGVFFRSSVVTLTVSLLVALFLLWIFGRVDADTGLVPTLHMTVALGLVTSLGASAAKLLL